MLSHLLSPLLASDEDDNESIVPRLADWKVFAVTVCIGALCENRSKIVLVSDSKVSFGDFSADMAVAKYEVIVPGWLTLFAGNDVEHIPFILERARILLLGAFRRNKRAMVTPAQVINAVQRAYDERLEEQIEAKVLRRYKFTCKLFRDEGKKKCTTEHYNYLCSKIANVKLSLSFLLAGFDGTKKGHLIVGGGNEAPRHYNALGFMAIGTGGEAAMSSLLFHKERQHLNESCSETQCVYLAYAAKFMAESSRDVGDKATTGFVAESTRVRTILEWQKLRNIWKEEGAPRLPKALEERISPLILSADNASQRAAEMLAQAERREAAEEEFKRLASQKSKDQQ